MPYYVFKISIPDGIGLVKKLDLVETCETFKQAKSRVRSLRSENTNDGSYMFKLMFGENQLNAEELLLEKREKPILMEHEK